MVGSSEVAQVIEALDAANLQMLDGSWEGWRDLLSHSDEVTLLGAQGGVIHGWTEAATRFERTAAGYGRGGGGIRSSRQNIATWVGQDLACLVDIEKHESRLEGETQPVTFFYRTTHVLRREEGAWKVVLRHADPLTDFRGPQFAHATATVSKPLSEETTG